jgi:hypothetical protein
MNQNSLNVNDSYSFLGMGRFGSASRLATPFAALQDIRPNITRLQ